MKLNDDELKSLWTIYKEQKDIKAKHKLIMHYVWLVKYVLQQMHLPSHSILEDADFLNIGILGLNESLERYELDRGVKFESYAIPRIRGIIQDELRKLDWLSRTARKKATELMQTTDKLRAQAGREVSTEEICQKLQITPDEYNSYLAAAAAAKASLTINEQPFITDEEPTDIFDDIADTSQENLLNVLENEERIRFITDYLTKLPERKRQVMALYYYENLTFKEIGQVLKVSESRICQIHTQIISDLRKKIIEFDKA